MGDLTRIPGKMLEVFAKLEGEGVNEDDIDRFLTDDITIHDVAVEFKRTRGKTSIGRTKAEEIMRKNFFGPKDWRDLFGVELTKEQLNTISPFPWDETVLNSFDELDLNFRHRKKIKETHFAFLGLDSLQYSNAKIPLTTEQIATGLYLISRAKGKFTTIMEHDHDLKMEDHFPPESCKFRWYLMPIQPFYCDTIYCLYEAATAVEEALKLLMYAAKHDGVFPYSGTCNIHDSKFSIYGHSKEESKLWIYIGRYKKSVGTTATAVSRKLPQ